MTKPLPQAIPPAQAASNKALLSKYRSVCGCSGISFYTGQPPEDACRGNSPASILALSGANAPAPPKGEPLAWRYTSRFKCKASGFARASPFGRGGTASAVTERASPLPPQRRACAESGAAPVAFLHDPSREKGVLKSPQAFQNPKLKIYFPLNMRKAQRRAFPIVLYRKARN